MSGLRFVDLFAGLGGFHLALAELGHECVFASELDNELRGLYRENFPASAAHTFGDIRSSKAHIPPHDILCAGFPCQPYSKSGFQDGSLDKTRGTLFHEILDVLKTHQPEFVLLENVGNFERHDAGNTWRVSRRSLERLGYTVRATEHVRSGGKGLLSPHHFGFPHSRERFYVIAHLGHIDADVWPVPDRDRSTNLASVLQLQMALSEQELAESALTPLQIQCIEHWNRLIKRIPNEELPWFPLWSEEFAASYPYEQRTPFGSDYDDLVSFTYRLGGRRGMDEEHLLRLLPSYARDAVFEFPRWKQKFIRQNRDWYGRNRARFPQDWIRETKRFPASLRKLEWNCKGEERDLWEHVLQFRPSGLRVKRMVSSPALVSMTTTQIPVIGPRRRFITRTEGLRLQGFPDAHVLPPTRDRAFKALGNAVHVGLVKLIAAKALATAAPRVVWLDEEAV